MQAETPARTHTQASSSQTRLFAGAAASQPGAWPPPGQGSHLWHRAPSPGLVATGAEREGKDDFAAWAGLTCVTETPKLLHPKLCTETGAITSLLCPQPSLLSQPDPSLECSQEGQVTDALTKCPKSPPWMGDSELAAGHSPIPNDFLTLNTWEGGSSASDFSCPYAMPGPASKPALLQVRLKPRSQDSNSSTLWAAASLPTEEQRPGLGFPQPQPPHPTGMWCPDGKGRTNKHLLLRRRVRCSWYLAQTRSGVPHKQTPPAMIPMESAPGTSLVSL